MNLYKIAINMPVLAPVYFVVASGFDEAANMAIAADTKHDGRNGGIDRIEVVGSFGDADENLLLSDEAASILRG